MAPCRLWCEEVKVPLRFWFAPGSQLCVIDRDRECWRGAPAAMFAVLMILAITTIAGALISEAAADGVTAAGG